MQDSSGVAGIDWASRVHAVCVLDGQGVVVERFDVAHDDKALAAMVDRLVAAGVVRVATVRGDGCMLPCWGQVVRATQLGMTRAGNDGRLSESGGRQRMGG